MAFKLALSAGHYLGTAGKQCLKALDKNQTKEWVLNDRIADKLQKLLAAYDGIEILRLDDTTGKTEVTLKQRSDKSNEWKADFYLSIHHNAGVNGGSGGGIVAYIYNGKVSSAAKEWQKLLYNELIAQTGLKGNRGTPLASANLHECREPKAPAVLLELGFMDSKTDVPIILTDSFATKCAQACCNVIVKKAKLKKKVIKESAVTGVAYQVVTALNRYDTAADALTKKNAKTTKLPAGTYYIYSKYPKGVNGMLNITSDKSGAKAGCWINPTENTKTVVTTKPTSINVDILNWQKAAIADGYKFKSGTNGKWTIECTNVAKKAICKKPLIKGLYKNKNLTKFLQKKMGYKGSNIDGKFWTGTEKDFKKYQKKLGFIGKEVDGICGYNSWLRILKINK